MVKYIRESSVPFFSLEIFFLDISVLLSQSGLDAEPSAQDLPGWDTVYQLLKDVGPAARLPGFGPWLHHLPVLCECAQVNFAPPWFLIRTVLAHGKCSHCWHSCWFLFFPSYCPGNFHCLTAMPDVLVPKFHVFFFLDYSLVLLEYNTNSLKKDAW